MTIAPEACPFCPPKVAEAAFACGEGVLALYNIAPVLPGHSLIVPARHAERLLDLAEDEVMRLTGFGWRITRFLMQTFGATGVDWTVQDGAEAGQTVHHLHLHLIPRIAGDLPEPGDWYQGLRDSERPASGTGRRARLEPDVMAAAVTHLRRSAAAAGLRTPDHSAGRPRSSS